MDKYYGSLTWKRPMIMRPGIFCSMCWIDGDLEQNGVCLWQLTPSFATVVMAACPDFLAPRDQGSFIKMLHRCVTDLLLGTLFCKPNHQALLNIRWLAKTMLVLLVIRGTNLARVLGVKLEIHLWSTCVCLLGLISPRYETQLKIDSSLIWLVERNLLWWRKKNDTYQEHSR